jgi:hypothetical protein
MLLSFRFSDSGEYTISVKIAAQFFITITPVFAAIYTNMIIDIL